jgi:hypothetical protein
VTTEDLLKFVRDGRNYAILEAEQPDLKLERETAEVDFARLLHGLEFTPGAVSHFLADAIRHITYNGHGIYDFAAAVEILHAAQKRSRV